MCVIVENILCRIVQLENMQIYLLKTYYLFLKKLEFLEHNFKQNKLINDEANKKGCIHVQKWQKIDC